MILGVDAAFTNAAWSPFDKAWTGERTSNDLACDTDYTVQVSVTYTSGSRAGLTGSDNSDIHINCNPRAIIDPVEKRVVIDQNNLDAFSVTIYDPDSRAFTLTMINDDPSQAYLVSVPWVTFVCPGLPVVCTSATQLDNLPASTPVTVKLTTDASKREGTYPIKFTGTTAGILPVTNKGVLIVTSEGLSEFAAWQLVALLLFASAVFAVINSRGKQIRRKRL